MAQKFPQLERPPIKEVICGFIFDPTSLDILDLGVYAEERRGDYPTRELLPPVLDRASIQIDINPVTLRARLVAPSDDRLIQLQPDRLYVNWRRRAEGYPRFSTHGDKPGLKAHALEEFSQFSSFIERRSGMAVALARLELSKVDEFTAARHYGDINGLKKLLRVAQVFDDISGDGRFRLQLSLQEELADSSVHVTISVGEETTRVETRIIMPAHKDLSGAFDRANERANRIFFDLIDVNALEEMR